MSQTTTPRINTVEPRGEYQVLLPYVGRGENAAARKTVDRLLVEAGFRLHEGEWWAPGLYARVCVDYDRGTIGVEVSRNSLAAYYVHRLNGTYDSLSLAEKHRLSGSPRSLEGWLESFDEAGLPRPTESRS